MRGITAQHCQMALDSARQKCRIEHSWRTALTADEYTPPQQRSTFGCDCSVYRRTHCGLSGVCCVPTVYTCCTVIECCILHGVHVLHANLAKLGRRCTLRRLGLGRRNQELFTELRLLRAPLPVMHATNVQATTGDNTNQNGPAQPPAPSAPPLLPLPPPPPSHASASGCVSTWPQRADVAYL